MDVMYGLNAGCGEVAEGGSPPRSPALTNTRSVSDGRLSPPPLPHLATSPEQPSTAVKPRAISLQSPRGISSQDAGKPLGNALATSLSQLLQNAVEPLHVTQAAMQAQLTALQLGVTESLEKLSARMDSIEGSVTALSQRVVDEEQARNRDAEIVNDALAIMEENTKDHTSGFVEFMAAQQEQVRFVVDLSLISECLPAVLWLIWVNFDEQSDRWTTEMELTVRSSLDFHCFTTVL